MKYKSLATSLIFMILLSLFLGTTHAATAADDFICRVGEDAYTSFADALTAVPNGGTITVLRDFTHTQTVTLGKSVTIDTGGCEATLSTSSGDTLKLLSGASLDLAGDGELNVVASGNSATALHVVDATVTVSNVSALTDLPGTPVTVFGTTSNVTITGNIYSAGITGEALATWGGNTYVGGDVVCENGSAVFSTGGTITIGGDAISRKNDGTGIFASDGTITVEGQILADNYIYAGGTTFSEGDGILEGNYRTYSAGTTTVRVRTKPVFRIGSDEYLTLEDTLAAAADGDTIQVLADHIHSGGTEISALSLTFDLNGHRLELVNPSGCALRVTTGGSVDLIGTGELNVTGDGLAGHGVHADGLGSNVTVTNATASDSGYEAHAAYATGGGTVTVLGDAVTTNETFNTHCRAAQAEDADSAVIVGGDAISAKSQGVYATHGTQVSIGGDVSSHYSGVDSNGASATVGGSITAISKGIAVRGGGSVVIDGDIIASGGSGVAVEVSGIGSTATVGGNALALGDHGRGTSLSNGATALIEGDIEAPNGTGASLYSGSQLTLEGRITAQNYLTMEAADLTEEDDEPVTTREGYRTYTDGSNVAWIALPRVCAIAGEEYVNLAEALELVEDGETIVLLADAEHNEGIVIDGKSVTLRLDGFTLEADNSGALASGPAVEIREGWSLTLEEGGGVFAVSSIIAGEPALHVLAGAEAEVSEVYSLDTGAGVHCNDGFVRVRGDVSTISVGIVASNEGVVEVDGDVTASQALTGLGVDVSGDGTVTVEGRIAAAQYLRLEDALRSSEGYDSISSGYYLYRDGGNTVRVAIDQCIVPGCSVTVAAGGFSDYTDIDGVRHYHVTSALQLAHVRDHPHLSFLQTDDIDLGDNDWIPLGLTYDDPYRGHYDGGGHEITGLSVNQTTTGRNHSGGLFGFLAGDASVRNLSVFGDVSYDCTWYATATYAGGIAAAAIAEGEMSPLIDNCSFRGNVSSVAHLNSSTSSMQAVAGGIVGLIRGGTVRNSSFDSGVISAEMIAPSGSRTYAYAGAIAADAQDSEILNCYVGANGRTSSSGAAHTFSGGVAGQTLGQSHVNATYFAGEILGSTPASDSDSIGGVCGAASDDTKVDGSFWNEACGTDLQVGNREATRDQGALSLAVMKTPSLRDKLEEALEGLGDDNLLSWIQTSGDYPVFAGEFWAPTPPSPPRRSGGDRSDPVLVSTETIEESIINSTDITASRTPSGWLAAPKSAVFDALLSKAMDTGGTRRDDSIVISIDDISETDELLVTLNSRDLTRISENTSANLEIRTALMDVSLNTPALVALISASDEDSVTLGMSRGGVRAGMPCWEIRAEGGGNPLSRLSSGYITVRIPHALAPDENPLTSVIRRVGEDDSFEIERGHYDEVSGVLVLRTSLLSSFALQQNSVEFADVPDDAWYREPVAFIAAREITSGTGDNKFSPDVPITRAQFVMLALNAYRLDRWIVDESPDSPAFVDITGGYYEEHLLLARRLGIVSGAGNDRFYPENPITRQEVFVIMRNLLNLIDELSDEKGIGELDRFVDGAEVAPWAQDATSTLVRAGIVKGDGYFLRPRAGATRAEIAQIFHELLSR